MNNPLVTELETMVEEISIEMDCRLTLREAADQAYQVLTKLEHLQTCNQEYPKRDLQRIEQVIKYQKMALAGMHMVLGE